jgi:hypothetical protein
VSIPQNAIPFTENGHPYVLEFDEYNAATLSPSGNPDDVGAGRIIDISDEKAPRIVGNLRLQINQPKEHAQYGDDPGAMGSTHGGAQGYAAHYCNIPTRVDPKIVACSFISSGLRLFNIEDLAHPREVGYFVAPTKAKPENGGQASDFAMSQPAFVPARHEVWFTDGTSGFYALKVTNGAWPSDAKCPSGSSATFTFQAAGIRSASAASGSKRVRVMRVKHAKRSVRVTVSTAGLKPGKLSFRLKRADGKTVTRSRTFKSCAAH